MNLWEIQPWVKGLIQANASLSAAGVTVLEDDGTYPKTPGKEDALATKGLVIIVWDIMSDGLNDVAQTGFASHDIHVPVVIEENVKVNRAAGGSQIVATKALQLVLESVSGKRPTMPASRKSPAVILPMDPPFNNFGVINGLRKIVVNFGLNTTLIPT